MNISIRKACRILATAAVLLPLPWAAAAPARLPGTGQTRCYDDRGRIDCPPPGQPYFGQDAQHPGPAPAYRDNGDGTVSDLNTGLMWSKAVDVHKVSLEEAERIARGMTLGGHRDWRVPTIKELYSLMDFRGYTGFSGGGMHGGPPANAIPFIDTDYFDFRYGGAGERYMDAQWLSSTRYVSTTMDGMETLFGVNFADGRIKGYGYKRAGSFRHRKKFYARYVRGPAYGENRFVDNRDGTVTDLSSGLTWMQGDSGKAMTWQEALAYAAGLSHAGHDDWRLPNAKELQYIVDYGRSPDTTGTAALAPVFQATAITNEAGRPDFAAYWTSTTHLDGPAPGRHAVYIAFGRALGEMRGRIMDVHGAGAQRSDPKSPPVQSGSAPQGDVRRLTNFVRCVRGGMVAPGGGGERDDEDRYPAKIRVLPAPSLSDREALSDGPPRGVGPGGQGQVRRRGGFVQRLDRDGDGRVSRAEFDGPPDRFQVHDADGDGYLTEDEAPRPPMPRGGGPGRSRP